VLIAERRRRLLEQVRVRGYISFRELADALGISESTVRRDLRSMVAEGLLSATRGGVGPLEAAGDGAGPGTDAPGGPAPGWRAPGPDGGPPGGWRTPGPGDAGPPGGWRTPGSTDAGPPGGWRAAGPADGAADSPAAAGARHGFAAPIAWPATERPPSAAASGAADPVAAEREAIAAHAAALVLPGSAILLGPGRTTTVLARYLLTIPHLTVVTNSLSVTQALFEADQIDVVFVGGALRRSISAVVGPTTEQALQGLRGAQVFLSGEGVTAERGLTTPNVFAAATDQALVAAARQVVVLADHTKLGHDTMCQTVPAERIDVLVTDGAADPDVLRRLRIQGTDVHVA
jgi:DeoR/GlpR family transcriptional regulator of sugar metabolism